MKGLRNVLLLLFLLVCAVSFWQAQRDPVPVSASEEASGYAAGASPVPGAQPKTIHLAVLNGSGQSGLARRYSRQLSPLGCVIVKVADAPHDSFPTSLLINRRLPRAEAEQLAARLNGVFLLLEWDDRNQEDATLVLGHDHRRLLQRSPVEP